MCDSVKIKKYPVEHGYINTTESFKDGLPDIGIKPQILTALVQHKSTGPQLSTIHCQYYQ